MVLGVMLSITPLLATQGTIAHVNSRTTRKPYGSTVTSHLQKPSIALAGIPALWI